jgi:clan AA aspartic protease (TIGR02281 family)
LPVTPKTKDKPYSDTYRLAQKYFGQHEFDLAINAYEQLLQNTATEEATELKSQWLDQAQIWLTEGEIALLKLMEQLFLKRFPNDFDFLLLEGERLALTESLFSERLSKITLPNLEKLMQSEAWDTVERFTEPLLQFEPDNERFLLILAEAYAQRQEVSLMEQTFSRVTYRENVEDEFQRIRQLIRYRNSTQSQDNQPQEESGRGVTLVQTGNHYIVTALLDNRSELDLLIDTGASTTAITRQRFNQLYRTHRPELIGRFPINTANGQVNAPIFRFSSLTIDEFQVNNFAVIVLPDRSNLDSDGLLGMNFLRHYDFRIDQRASELHLQRR